MKTRVLIAWCGLAALAGLAAGVAWGLASRHRGAAHGSAAEPAAAEYTCSMHPQIRQPKPGRCPLCGMDLIPAATSSTGGTGEGRQLRLSDAARKLAEVETAVVTRGPAETALRFPGRVEIDATRVRKIAPLTEGRLEKLEANYPGAPVRAGDTVAEIYSPEVYAASRDLLVLAKPSAGEADTGLVKAAREKLGLLGVGGDDIRRALESGEPLKTFALKSPVDGVVTELEAVQGQWLDRGMTLAVLTDLSVVWIQLDAYETDVARLRAGQAVGLSVDALPGRAFTGTVSFVSPVLDGMSRAVRVRVETPNPDGALKPGMLVRAEVRLDAGAGADGLPLLVPATAPLLTGRRAIVYVAVPGQEGVYEGREVQLGPRTGDHYIVASGLKDGERVVVRGNFNIDSALQILARPSMMTASGGEPPAPAPPSLRAPLSALLDAYLAAQSALAADDGAAAKAAAKAMDQTSEESPEGLSGERLERWRDGSRRAREAAAALSKAPDLAGARAVFEGWSLAAVSLARTFGGAGRGDLHVVRCPMAFDNRGAEWLQAGTDIRNPYFGKDMLACGEILGAIP